METRPRKSGRTKRPEGSMVGKSLVCVIVALMGVSNLRGYQYRGVSFCVEYGECCTPGSETSVPAVTWPRTSLPPVDRLPDPMGS